MQILAYNKTCMRLQTYISVSLQIVTNNYSKLRSYQAQTKFDTRT